MESHRYSITTSVGVKDGKFFAVYDRQTREVVEYFKTQQEARDKVRALKAEATFEVAE